MEKLSNFVGKMQGHLPREVHKSEEDLAEAGIDIFLEAWIDVRHCKESAIFVVFGAMVLDCNFADRQLTDVLCSNTAERSE